MQRMMLLAAKSSIVTAKQQLKKDIINLKNLESNFKKHFEQQYRKYEMPLLLTDGLLSYTSRFAKTVINQQYNENERIAYFMIIKKSYNTNKKFTIQSCVDTCESLINFTFQGEENKILEKLRNFAKVNEKVLSSKQADRFNRAHKFLMAEKADDSAIKFKDFSLNSPKTENKLLEEKFRKILKEGQITQFQIDWTGKKQLNFELDLYGTKRIIKIVGIDEKKSKDEDIYVLAKKIREASKQKDVFVVNLERDQSPITPQKITEKLLKGQRLYQEINQIQLDQKSMTRFQKLLKQIKEIRLPVASSSKIAFYQNSNIKYLNYILENNNNDELKELFGYAKINIFHIEFENVMTLVNRAKQLTIPQLNRINYTQIFEQEEQEAYNIISLQQLNAKAILEMLRQNKQKRLVIFCNEHKIHALLSKIFKLLKKPIDLDKAKENRKASILRNKLAIASLIYQIPLELPAISDIKTKYQQNLHPITYLHYCNA